ncbi:MAG: hypothetical protein AAGE94_12950 [Acidobacteriota bacterium]
MFATRLFVFVCLSSLVGFGALPVAAESTTADAKSQTPTDASAAAATAVEATAAVSLRDGRLFDPGVTMTTPAEGAPAELARLTPFVGDWDVEMDVIRPGPDGPTVLQSTGRAKVTFMNRGHAVLERVRVADFDGQGHAMSTHTFLVVDGNGTWSASEANSWTQSIVVTSGGFEDDGRLVLHHASRAGGGPALMHFRRTYTAAPTGEGATLDRFTMTLEMSTDLAKTWATVVERRFTRRSASDDFFPVRDDVGEPASDLVAEAGQFDFLLGEYTATHWLKRPTGELRWQSDATAVRILDGHGILEFSSFDTDPNKPDVATSIIRLYNQSMRRWESLYLTNRTQSPLYFGGVREGDRMVLHPFAAQTGANPIFQWIFFDVEENTYRWKGIQSNDRGVTWDPTWTIDFVRKGTEDADAG